MITLKTLPQATAQEVFDQVVSHLLTQKTESFQEDEDTCAYYGMNGLRCAAGCLIDKDEYDKTMENKSWAELMASERVPFHHGSLISDMQSIHDDFSPSVWFEKLSEYASENHLSPAILHDFQ